MSIGLVTDEGQRLLERGRLAEAREQLWLELERAERDGDVDAFARAALGLGGVWVHEHRRTLDRARVLDAQRRALAALEADGAMAHRLRSRLAAEHGYLDQDASEVLVEVDAARRRGDPLVLAEALSLAHHCLLGPDHRDARLALADELIGVSAGTGRALDGLHGLVWRTVDLFLAGDRHAERALAELRQRLEMDRCDCFAYVVAALEVMLAVRAGRLAEAEVLAGACYELGTAVGDADALGWLGGQLIAIRWFQGRCDELLPAVRDLAHSTTLATPNEACFAGLAAVAVASGDMETARGALASLTAGGLAAIPRSSNWLATLFAICEAAHALDDRDAAGEAYELLLPFAELPVTVSLAVACFGSTHRPLGLAAETLGDLDLAVRHLEAALVADLSVQHRPAHVLACATLAGTLERRGGSADRLRAAELRRAAVERARELGMAAHADRWDAAPGSAPVVSFVADGSTWQVSVDNRCVAIPQSVGASYLAALVARTGEAVPSLELASGGCMTLRGDQGEVVLDDAAKAAYRRRIEELQDDIDDAEANADIERAARAHAELDRYLEELARATGLSRRSRRFDDEAERARVSVHKAIKRALRQLDGADPAVGTEFRARVVTGMRCVFLARAGDLTA